MVVTAQFRPETARETPISSTYGRVQFEGFAVNGAPFIKTDVFGFGPEDLQSYELDMHSEWLEHRLRVSADVFFFHLTQGRQQEVSGMLES